MTVPSVLPPNRTPWELAISQTSGDRRPTPTHLVKDIWNPDACPVEMLGWLAYQLSVDIWDEDWAETEKRNVCRQALQLHRIKTTAAGIKAHVALTGATVKRIVRPPARGFRYGARTPDQQAAWLDSLPQVRVYPFLTDAVARPRAMFSSIPGGKTFRSFQKSTIKTSEPTPGVYSPIGLTQPGSVESVADGFYYPLGFTQPATVEIGRGSFFSPLGIPVPDPTAVFTRTGFNVASRGTQLFGVRATYADDGAEQDIDYQTNADGSSTAYIGAIRHRLWYGGGSYYSHGYREETMALDSTVSFVADNSAESFAIPRGATPVNVQPQMVYEQRSAPAARAFVGRFRGNTFRLASYAQFLIYDKVSIVDPTKLGTARATRSYYGYGRYGIDDYTAEIRIDIPMLRPRARSGKWYSAGFRQAADMTPLQRAIEAVRVSKSFRDTVLIDTTTYEVVSFGGTLTFGDFQFGEIREVT